MDIDPPYYKAPYYDHNMELTDFQQLATTLAAVQGKFTLSINDHPVMRDTFSAFNIQTAKLKYTVARNKAKAIQELIITNFKTGSKGI